MKTVPDTNRWVYSALIGLGLTGAILNVKAQATADLNINTFETANTVIQGQNPQFPQFAADAGSSGYCTVAWDNSTETYGGSCKVTSYFLNASFGQVLNIYGCMGGTPYLMNTGPLNATNAAANSFVFTNYVSVDFDVMWDTNNSTMSLDYFNSPLNNGPGMWLRGIKTNTVAGTRGGFFDITSKFNIPGAASNGWVHVSLPITSSSNALCKGIYFVKTGVTGVATNGGTAQFWIDNVTLKAPTNPAVAILDSDNFQSYPPGQDLTTGGYGWSIYVNSNTNVVWGNPTITYTPATNQYVATTADTSALPTQGTYWSGTIQSGVRPMPAGISTNLANIQLNLDVVEIGNYTHGTAPVKLMLQSLAANGTTITGESDLTNVLVWYQWMNRIGGVLTNFTPTSYQTYSTNGSDITTNIVYTPFDPTAPNYRYCLFVDQGWEFLWPNINVIKIGNVVLSNPNAQAAVTPPTITLNTPTNNASYVAYGNIPLSATVSSNNNAISYVQFLSGATVLAAVTNPPYAATWNFVAPGSYPAVTAQAIYGSGSVTSAVAAVTVNAAVAPVVSAPTHNGSGYSFSISGPTGQPYTILTTTNVALPLSSWSVAQTNSAFVAGAASYTNSTPNDPQRYYRVKTP